MAWGSQEIALDGIRCSSPTAWEGEGRGGTRGCLDLRLSSAHDPRSKDHQLALLHFGSIGQHGVFEGEPVRNGGKSDAVSSQERRWAELTSPPWAPRGTVAAPPCRRPPDICRRRCLDSSASRFLWPWDPGTERLCGPLRSTEPAARDGCRVKMAQLKA
jgi:hypothetical protein